MFLRLNRDRLNGVPPSRIWRHLDYPPQTFDGIQLWDLLDRLDDREAGRLVELCHTMVKPKGMVIVFALGEQPSPSQLNAFAIGEEFRMSVRPQPHLDLPTNFYHNRQVIAMMAPFSLVKSFIYRSGLREFLFQRNED